MKMGIMPYDVRQENCGVRLVDQGDEKRQVEVVVLDYSSLGDGWELKKDWHTSF